jgi:hypothetical protein
VDAGNRLWIGEIAGELLARSIIRRVAWLYIGLTVATWVFEEACAGSVNATDWSVEATRSKAITLLVMVAPPLLLLATRRWFFGGAMIVIAAFVAFVLGSLSVWLGELRAAAPLRLDPWLLGLALLTLAWIVAAAASCRAFQAANLLRRLARRAPQTAAAIFE